MTYPTPAHRPVLGALAVIASLCGLTLVFTACGNGTTILVAGELPDRTRAEDADPFVPDEPPVPQPEYDELAAQEPFATRIMSFNILWEPLEDERGGMVEPRGWMPGRSWRARREQVFEVLAGFQLDSAGLQEPSANQVDEITEAVPEFVDGTADGTNVRILVRDSRFEIASSGTVLLFEGARDDDGSRRTGAWVRLRERTTGRAYYHFNVHLDHRDARSREISVVRLVRAITAREFADPFVVTGDFNASEDSPEMRYLRGLGEVEDTDGRMVSTALPLVDSYRVLFPTDEAAGTFGNFEGDQTGPKIDHILVEPSTWVLDAGIVRDSDENGFYPSDHYPVTAVLQWSED